MSKQGAQAAAMKEVLESAAGVKDELKALNRRLEYCEELVSYSLILECELFIKYIIIRL